MTRWASFVVTRKWWVLAVVVAAALVAGVWGAGVFGQMSDGGFVDPHSESAEVADIVEENLGARSPDIVVLYTPEDGRSLDDIGPAVSASLDEFAADVPTESVTSYWDGNPQSRQLQRAEDGTSASAAITLDPDSGVTMATFADLLPKLEIDGVQTQFAGNSVVGVAFTEQLQHDLVLAEAIALPVTLVLLFFVFGGLVAAAVPVFVGAMAVMVALAVLRLLTLVTDVSSFAVNVASLLGLGLAIDYGLFVVGRFREEMRSGATTRDATARTVLSAGRTIAFSGLLLMCAFAGMLVFPQGVVKSLGLGAMAAVFGAAVLSLTIVPALLAILGPRIDAITWRKGAADRAEERAHRFWGRVVTAVMRRPAVVAVTIVAGLLVLAFPLTKASFGEVTYTALPEDDPARIAAQTLSDEYPTTGNGATLVLRAADGTPPTVADGAAVAAEAGKVPGIAAATVLGSNGQYVGISAVYSEGVSTDQQSDAVSALRGLSPPDGTELLVGGGQATVDDSNAAIVHWLPVMIAIMVLSTLVLLFLAFGSIVLPLKAVAMAGLSLAATFGVLTWVFQLGHGASLLGVTPNALEPTFVVLILAVVFGLSTDYEVFLLSRMVEARTAGASTEDAVRFGAQTTGRIVTAAALLLVVVTGAFTISGLSIMRFLGVGMIVALLVDATIVRMLLVPSLVKLMGNANWWAPTWMKKVHSKVGIGH
ncbi:MMPL family transporter [Rhodococcus sp. HNM0569]|uniref:MMPL family transporter n=1 Tax=Rhodococcus sp. HNM0569 TaxID=2716340 RepID=UPI00146EC9A6|nr:MMPL family transporter [Rhodococcus sp. HNM0569]NLU81809.1 MMPL family transporter [Rhodococcus sp. HNM0569]